MVSTRSGEVTRFSTARTTPSFVLNPMAVDPNCKSKRNNNISITLHTEKTHIIPQVRAWHQVESGFMGVSVVLEQFPTKRSDVQLS